MSTQRDSVFDRAVRVSLLKSDVYQRIERDPEALGGAAIVVTVVAIAAAIGAIEGGFWALVVGIIGAALWWLINSAVTFSAGKLFYIDTMPATTDFHTVLRLMGYAQAPRVLTVFGVIPMIDWLGVVGWLLAIFTGRYAVQQALKVSLLPAILISIAGTLATVAVIVILLLLLDIPLSPSSF